MRRGNLNGLTPLPATRRARAPGGMAACFGRLCAVLLAAAPFAASSTVNAGELRVWPTAVVSHGDVTLLDVAEFVDFSRDELRTLEATVVSPSPCEGGESLVTIEDVRRALTDVGANLAGVRIMGASRCKVSRPLGLPKAPVQATRKPPSIRGAARAGRVDSRSTDNPLSSSENRAAFRDVRTLETVLREFLSARMSQHPGRLDVRFSAANRANLSLSADEMQFDVEAVSPVKPGLVTLEVQARSGDQSVQTIPVVAELALLRDVVVARRAINRGRAIEAADLAVQERRFSDATDIGMTETTAAVGQRAKEFIQAGEMLTAGLIEAAPVVERGDAVTIWIRRGGVVVKSSGRAQQQGGLGDVIAVRRDGTKRKQDLIEAMVTGPGTVTISDSPRLASR